MQDTQDLYHVLLKKKEKMAACAHAHWQILDVYRQNIFFHVEALSVVLKGVLCVQKAEKKNPSTWWKWLWLVCKCVIHRGSHFGCLETLANISYTDLNLVEWVKISFSTVILDEGQSWNHIVLLLFNIYTSEWIASPCENFDCLLVDFNVTYKLHICYHNMNVFPGLPLVNHS